MFSSKTVSFLVAAVAFTVSACSTPPVAGEAASTEAGEHSILGLYHAPTPVSHPRAAQREWQAAQHWERLAAAVAKEFAAARARRARQSAAGAACPPGCCCTRMFFSCMNEESALDLLSRSCTSC